MNVRFIDMTGRYANMRAQKVAEKRAIEDAAWAQHIHEVRRKAGQAAQAKVGSASHMRMLRQRQVIKHLEKYAPHLVAEYEAAYAAAETETALAAQEN